MYDKRDRMVKHHLNQALALNIVGVLVSAGSRLGGMVEVAAGIIGFLACILTIMGIIRALQLSDKPLPVIGNFKIL